ncbi:hypothetical protein FVER53590_25846 [Fusarium verticillioides]|nr:hypothetical protein FVER53590_25846 [Fusarium verticillioides]
MTCRLASLPEEILAQIVDNLCLRSIARLMRCSTKLYLRLEPYLLKSDVARNLALKWACTRASPDHAATVLHRLVRDYGVSPSVLEIPTGKPDDSGQRMMIRKVFTGALAMKAGRVDILPVLAYLGASLDDPVLRRDNYRLRFNWPFRSSSPDWGMVRAFVETGWPRQLSHWLLGRLLINLIMFKASPYLIDRVIDMGADVNLVTDYGGDAWISPLGATVLMDSALTFRRLIARGARLRSKAIDDSKRNALHCPLSVAVGKISERGLDLVDLCLEFGANINQKVFRTEHKDPVISACTPLARYLSSKRSSAPNPVVVKYFIEKGALVKLIPQYDQPKLLNPPSLIKLLLESWPYYSVVSLLAQQPAQEVIKLLVQHGAADGCILDLIMHWVYPDSRGWV